MLYWFADDSGIISLNDMSVQDVFLIGGIVISSENLIRIQNIIEGIKGRYCGIRAPIKWNIKDLKSTYKKHGMEEKFNLLMENSKEIRREILSEIQEVEFEIIISGIESFSVKKATLVDIKDKLSTYAFSSGLMGFAKIVEKSNYNQAMVVLDWPNKGEPDIFNFEYSSAYNYGKSLNKKFEYKSGKLRDLGFSDSIMYSKMVHSTLLQVSDLILGCTKDQLESLFEDKKEKSFGIEMYNLIKNKFRGFPNNLEWGLIIAKSSPRLYKLVKQNLY